MQSPASIRWCEDRCVGAANMEDQTGHKVAAANKVAPARKIVKGGSAEVTPALKMPRSGGKWQWHC